MPVGRWDGGIADLIRREDVDTDAGTLLGAMQDIRRVLIRVNRPDSVAGQGHCFRISYRLDRDLVPYQEANLGLTRRHKPQKRMKRA